MAQDSGTAGSGMMVVERDGVPVAKFTAGDFNNASLLEDTFQVLISTLKRRNLVVDLSEIQSTMSLGIAVLVAAQGLALIHKTKLAFAAVGPDVTRLLALTGADKVLTVFDTVGDAVRAMQDDSGRAGQFASGSAGVPD